jgi:hypothetical protein
MTLEGIDERRPDAVDRFYQAALTEAERECWPVARQIEGLEQEIALLRLRLRRAIEERPEDLPLMFRGIDLLARVVSARYRLSKGSRQDLNDSLRLVLESVHGAEPEGGPS